MTVHATFTGPELRQQWAESFAFLLVQAGPGIAADLCAAHLDDIAAGAPPLAPWGTCGPMPRIGGRRLEFFLAVPARRYAEVVETFRALSLDDAGMAEASFAGARLIVANAPLRAEEQTTRRRARIADFEAMAEKMVARLDAQDDGKTARATAPAGWVRPGIEAMARAAATQSPAGRTWIIPSPGPSRAPRHFPAPAFPAAAPPRWKSCRRRGTPPCRPAGPRRGSGR